jgi:hypothetical protein
MANTSYLQSVVEPHIVRWLSERIGIPLKPRPVPVGRRTDGEWVNFAFDGVSDDGQVGVLISTSHTVKPGGTRKLHVDASILLQAPFARRFMVFVNHDAKTNFVNKCDGLLPLSKIEMFVCEDLPADMLAEIARIQADAKSEVGDQGKHWKPGGKRK